MNGDFKRYEEAKPDLVSRLGMYCSYCERPIHTLLAVEHIKPKETNPQLERKWSNFLLACVNCNSCKGSSPVDLQIVLLPDRDNTFFAYTYEYDGSVNPSNALSAQQVVLASNTLELVGLDKSVQAYRDSNDQLVALDRPSQRMEAIGVAQSALSNYTQSPNTLMADMILKLALATGYFSIWMKVFDRVPEIKLLLIKSFSGTEASECFDLNNGADVVPAPNPDGWVAGNKV
ncbi:HNH endonuclease [Vreelandella alkaliphila]|uniref:HNH endonuclease n=1 Tax=Vreelandella alkaliphila TaxID=272774 RepID=UPI003FD85906